MGDDNPDHLPSLRGKKGFLSCKVSTALKTWLYWEPGRQPAQKLSPKYHRESPVMVNFASSDVVELLGSLGEAAFCEMSGEEVEQCLCIISCCDTEQAPSMGHLSPVSSSAWRNLKPYPTYLGIAAWKRNHSMEALGGGLENSSVDRKVLLVSFSHGSATQWS